MCAGDWIRPVQHIKRPTRFAGFLQGVEHRARIRVEAGAYILNVVDDSVEVLHLGGCQTPLVGFDRG